MADKGKPTKGTYPGHYQTIKEPHVGLTGGGTEKVWIPGKEWVQKTTPASGEHPGSSTWVLQSTKPPADVGGLKGKAKGTGPSSAPTESPASQQMMAMQGAVSGALNSVLQQLFPSSTIPIYNQSVDSGLAMSQGALTGSNPGLQALSSQIMASNPSGAGAMAKAQNVGNLVSGTTLGQASSQLGSISNYEQQLNSMYEESLPGLLQKQGATTLPTAYYTDLANALKYEQIYSAGINPTYVPASLQPFATGASSTAQLTTGAGSVLASGVGPGNNQTPNPYSTKTSTTPA